MKPNINNRRARFKAPPRTIYFNQVMNQVVNSIHEAYAKYEELGYDIDDLYSIFIDGTILDRVNGGYMNNTESTNLNGDVMTPLPYNGEDGFKNRIQEIENKLNFIDRH